MPEVSVVVPVYNVEEYLPKCLDSILSQTFADFELIVVNDGSKDNGLAIAREYEAKDKRVTVIDQKNGGLSSARNTGLKRATGDYICFIDSDDFVEPTMLEKCVYKLKQTDADMVMFDVYQYHMMTGLKETIVNCYDEDSTYSLDTNPEMITRIMNAAWNKMYRRSLFTDNHIEYPVGYYYEDLGTTYRLLNRCTKIAFINEPLYDYLVDRPGNITRQFNRSVYQILDMISLVLDDYKQRGLYERYYEELKFLGCVNILECLKKTRNVKDKKETEAFIDACFAFLKKTWPEYWKCHYPILREKNDWVYTNPIRLKLYLNYKRTKMKGE